MLNGFYNYYAVPTNFRALNAFYYHVLCALAALPPATKPATQADVAEDDADRGALAAQSEVAAPLSRLAVRRHDPRWEPGALAAHAGICAGGGEQSPSLSRRFEFNDLPIHTDSSGCCQILVDSIWRLQPLQREGRFSSLKLC